MRISTHVPIFPLNPKPSTLNPPIRPLQEGTWVRRLCPAWTASSKTSTGEVLYCLGFRVQGLGFRKKGLGFRVQGLGFRVQGLGFGVEGLGFRMSGLEIRRKRTRKWKPPHCLGLRLWGCM